MKLNQIITTLLLSFCTSIQAQWVSIPDTNFVNFLTLNYPQCMNGNQMDTTCQAIQNEYALNCNSQSISDLSGIGYFINLRILSCNQNQLDVLPPLPQFLLSLYCNENNLQFLPSLPDSLIDLFCQGNQLDSLPMLPYTLRNLACQDNNLSTLPTLPNSLEHLACGNNQLVALPPLPVALTSLTCFANMLTGLPDLPDSLVFLFINDNPGITCLPQISKIDQFEFNNTSITCLSNYIQIAYSNPPLSFIPLCDIYNVNGCPVLWNISGKTYSDINDNCLEDSLDTPVKNTKIKLFKNGILEKQVITGSEGYYSFDTDLGNYTISVDTIHLPAFVSCPASASYNSILLQNDSMHYDKNFAMKCKTTIDIGVKNIQKINGGFFPGNNTIVNISAGDLSGYYGLNCASGTSGTVVVHFPPLLSFVSEFPGSLVPNCAGDSLTYYINDFGDLNLSTDFWVLFETDSSATICDILPISATVYSSTPDYNLSNNMLIHYFRALNSCDPNSKEVSPPDTISPSQEWLTYTIHFQNIGTAPAQHVFIIDTLSGLLDPSTFELLAYSHPNLTSLTGNVVTFNFPNINLPDSNTNPLASNGYIQFKIRILSGLSIGSLISNKADIFFDFNSPITTNVTENLISNVVSISEHEALTKYKMYPNPVLSNTTLQVNSDHVADFKILIFNSLGQPVDELFNGIITLGINAFSLQIDHLDGGVYYLLAFENGVATYYRSFVKL